MEYQEPKLETIYLDRETIVHTSLTGESGGGGVDIGGDGTNPWE